MNNTTLTQAKGNTTKSLDLTFVRLVQQQKRNEQRRLQKRNEEVELQERNAKAKAYSTYVRKAQTKAKAKEIVKTIVLLLSTVGIFVWMIFDAFGFWNIIF